MADRPGTPRTYLPVALDLTGRPSVVIGGGAVGTRKATTLADAGAQVTVVAPAITNDLRALVRAGRVRWLETTVGNRHLQGAFLVVAATDDPALNAAVTSQAREAGALTCDASSATDSELIFGALLQRGDVTIAVFTGGRDPSEARRTRDRLATLLPSEPERKPEP